MHRCVENKVGQHLAIGAGITAHGQIRLILDTDREIIMAQSGPQTFDNLISHLTNIEASPIRNVTVGGNLLERLC
jgi:hypothetical protein